MSEEDASKRPAQNLSQEKRHVRADEVRAVIASYDETAAWDHLQAKDLDPRITDYVAEQLKRGKSPAAIAKLLSLKGGLASRQWKKIQAYFRQGFRADAEAYLYQQTHKYYKVIEQAKEILEDAFQNGTPQVITDKEGGYKVIRVKGATKELGSFLESYSRSIALPVKLWKDYGAIGEKRDQMPQGMTIVVENKIPMPSFDEIKAHQEEMKARQRSIELKTEQYQVSEEVK